MSPVSTVSYITDTSFPRVSGDEHYADIVAMLLDVFSPRERG